MKPLPSLLITCIFLPVTAWAAETPPLATPDQAAVVEGNNAFAVDLYGHLRKRSGNLFFSPESISTAFAMAYAGARGDTASEMATTLHFTLPPDKLHPAMGALLAGSQRRARGLSTSRGRRVCGRERRHAFLDDFLKLTESDYGAGFNRVDFKGATGAGARRPSISGSSRRPKTRSKIYCRPGVLDAIPRGWS